MLSPSRPRQHDFGRYGLKRSVNRDVQVVVGHVELHAMQLHVFGRFLVEEHDARFDCFHLPSTRASAIQTMLQPGLGKAKVAAGTKQRVHVAVKVRNVQRACPFEHIVDVLRDEPNPILPPDVLPRRENRMCFVRARIPLLRNSLVIETEDRLPALPPAQEVTDLVEVFLGPNAVTGTERRNPAFYR